MNNIIDKIRYKKQQLEQRKTGLHNNFSKTIAVGMATLVTGISYPQLANAEENPLQDKKSDHTELLKGQENLSAPVYFNVIELQPEQDFDKVISSHPKAAYDATLDCVVCYTYQLSDANAYKKVRGKDLRNYTVDDAIGVLQKTLTGKKNYQGQMPHNLSDVKKVLEGLANSGLKDKAQKEVQDVIRSYRLDQAAQLKDMIDKVNDSHTSSKVVMHEFIHKKNASTLRKALLPSSVVSLQQQYLLRAADEIEAQLLGRTGKNAADDAVRSIRSSAQNYAARWYDSVMHNKAIAETSYKQNLAVRDGIVVDTLGNQNFDKLLKEMIPDDASRATVKLALEQIKKDKRISDHTEYGAPYEELKALHNMRVRDLDAAEVESMKFAPWTDEEMNREVEKRRQSQKDDASQQYGHLVNASGLYEKSDSDKVIRAGNINKVNDVVSGRYGNEFSAEKFLAMADKMSR